MTMQTDRRTVITAGATLATLAATATTAVPSAAAPGPAALPLTPQPLPFDPARTGWLSEKLLVSHHDNNYAGAVKRLAAIKSEFGKLDVAATPGFAVNGLKREELIAWNSMILHELYFAGLTERTAPSTGLAQAIERDFGSQAQWAAEFSAMGKALGGGSGWVLLTYSPRDAKLTNQWAADHTMALVGATPILALDMYEHAYALDFGAKAGAYVDGFMKSASWANASKSFERVA
jgi:Fe-Mn family superoxide dismutase